MRPNYRIPPGPKPGPWGPAKSVMISMPVGLLESLKRHARRVGKPFSRVVCDLVASGIGSVPKAMPPAVAYIERLIQGLSDVEIAECREHLGLARMSAMDNDMENAPLTTREQAAEIVSELAYRRTSTEAVELRVSHSDTPPQIEQPQEPTEERRKE